MVFIIALLVSAFLPYALTGHQSTHQFPMIPGDLDHDPDLFEFSTVLPIAPFVENRYNNLPSLTDLPSPVHMFLQPQMDNSQSSRSSLSIQELVTAFQDTFSFYGAHHFFFFLFILNWIDSDEWFRTAAILQHYEILKTSGVQYSYFLSHQPAEPQVHHSPPSLAFVSLFGRKMRTLK